MDNIKDQLFKYGMPDFQITKLLKTKKVATGHGIYTLKGSALYLDGKKVIMGNCI